MARGGMARGGLGRLYAPDERDRKFMLPARRTEAKPIEYRMWSSPGVLDQGQTPMCVGYSSYKFLTSAPVINKPAGIGPADVYRMAQDADEWPGSDYEGSSVRGAFKALKAAGYVESYHWAPGCEAVIDHLLLVGPVVMGTDWLAGMSEPDRHGVMHLTGEVEGGHAWLLVGASRKRGMVRMVNSWGKVWAESGRAWLAFDDLDKLIKRQGEACVAVEVKHP